MKEEYLPNTLEGKLIHVVEECAEVTKCITKIQRFGLHSRHPKKKVDNVEALRAEVQDLKRAWLRLDNHIKQLEAESLMLAQASLNIPDQPRRKRRK